MPWGEWGVDAFLEALGGKAARMAASLTCARTIQAEEKEIALRFMSEKFISFVLFPVSVRPGIFDNSKLTFVA